LNLQSNPEAAIEVGRRRLAVTATTASPDERPRLWALAREMYAGFEDYKARTTREIPVVILMPI
jgi:deazaflavin-dependent oxidoreductase (nitroreductase family)